MELNKTLSQDELALESDQANTDVPDEIEINNKQESKLGFAETKLVLNSGGHSLELHTNQSSSMERTCEIGLWLLQNMKGDIKSQDKKGSYLG